MFKASNSTVFILGAGASWHYGYPTGETLVEKVIEKAAIALRYFEHSADVGNPARPEFLVDQMSDQWEKAATECRKLKNGLEQVNPLVIDYYLGWNSGLQNVGRLLIAWVILESEHKSKDRNLDRDRPGVTDTAKYRDDWVRFIIHQIAIHCRESSDLLQNKVSFVTFNYDVSLEMALRNGLNHIQLFSKDDVTKFLDGRIIHIYGKVRDPHVKGEADWNYKLHDPKMLGSNTGDYHTKMKILLDAAYTASKELRVIDPHDKSAGDTEIKIAQTVIANAQRVFILGYGFDEHNNGRLNLHETLRLRTELANKRIAFTNYQDINQINKRASKLFYGGPQYFPPGGPAIQDRFEKSTRNTYDALALDFDLAD
jgi:hypothetical protein